jgi:hypothetical protein
MSLLGDVVDRPVSEADIEAWLREKAVEVLRSKRVIDFLSYLFREVENRVDVVDRVEMNADDFGVVRRHCREVFDAEGQASVLRTGMMGQLWTANLYVGKCFREPAVWGRRELPPEDGLLWVRRGWEVEAP